MVDACTEQVDRALARGGRPVMLCSARVRRHLRRLCEQRLPQLAVCSYNEIAPGVSVETIGVLDATAIAGGQGAAAMAAAG
jgi:flagellar biosynthesis protein FlhA